ncbi:MAG: HD domain-containing protein [Candidatus Aenigmatarchaeota archaeon]
MHEFIGYVNKLKDIKRTGWVERGVKNPESSAEHSFMAAVLSMLLAKNVDEKKVIKMALIHDLAESVVGDIITKENWPSGGTVTEKEKMEKEEKAVKKMTSSLSAKTRKEVIALWEEYNQQKTRESVFVRDIDIAERLIQAKIYHDRGNYKKPIEGFWKERNISMIKNKEIRTFVIKYIGGE